MVVDYDVIKRRSVIEQNIRKGIIYVLLALWAIIVLFPFYWMLLSSIKSYQAYNSESIPKFFTLKPTLENYQKAFSLVPLAKYFLNTIIFSLGTTILMIFTTILAAFALSRLEFKGKKIIFTVILSLMMIPTELVIITNYVTITNLGLRNTMWGLILPSVGSVFYIYLLKENFEVIPDSIYQAAKVDGTSDWNYLWKVMVPIAKPTVVSILILKIIECWNSYAWPRLITDQENKFLIAQGIQEIRENGFGRADVPAMMAAVVVVSIPIIILFIVFRKQIMSGVSKSGTKG